MKTQHIIATIICVILLAACGQPKQASEEPSQVISTADSLRADSIYNLAQTLFQNALDYRDKDSTVACCKEYYRALEVLEEHFSTIQSFDVEQLTKQDKQIIPCRFS